MGRAEDLFVRLEQQGDAYLEELLQTRKAEEAFLDFKRSADDGAGPRLHDRDRNNLARALSGFGNSDGGVLVWGVECDDVATARRPLADSAAFVSRLESAVSGLTVPPVLGVRSIPLGAQAATLIPSSVNAPHQLVQEKRYLLRVGSSFEPAPHGVLAGMFGRKPPPYVFHNFFIKPASVLEDGSVAISFDMVLCNEGTVVAEDLFVALLIRSSGGEGCKLSVVTPPNGGFRLMGASENTVSAICHRDLRLAPGGVITVLHCYWKVGHVSAGLDVRLRAGCNGAIPHEQSLLLPAETLFGYAERARQDWQGQRGQIDWHRAASVLLGLEPHW